MAIQPQAQGTQEETLNVKLLHATKQNSPYDPVQLAFAVVDEQGIEQILTAEVPSSYDLFTLIQEEGWFAQRRGIQAIRAEGRRGRVAA